MDAATSHFFVKRSVYEKYGVFNLKFGSAANYELMLRFLLK
jgi:glycosyltransferase